MTRYRSSAADLPEHHFKTLQSQISDAERFKDVEPLNFKCRSCGTTMLFDGLDKNSVRSTAT